MNNWIEHQLKFTLDGYTDALMVGMGWIVVWMDLWMHGDWWWMDMDIHMDGQQTRNDIVHVCPVKHRLALIFGCQCGCLVQFNCWGIWRGNNGCFPNKRQHTRRCCVSEDNWYNRDEHCEIRFHFQSYIFICQGIVQATEMNSDHCTCLDAVEWFRWWCLASYSLSWIFLQFV